MSSANDPGQHASASAAWSGRPAGLPAATPRNARPLATIVSTPATFQSAIDPDARSSHGQSGKNAATRRASSPLATIVSTPATFQPAIDPDARSSHGQSGKNA